MRFIHESIKNKTLKIGSIGTNTELMVYSLLIFSHILEDIYLNEAPNLNFSPVSHV